MELSATMERVGEVSTSGYLDSAWLYEEKRAATSNSSFVVLSSSAQSNSQPDFVSSSSYDPCFDSIADHVCINYLQLTIICIACFTILFMIAARLVFCCLKRRRQKKNMPDILSMEDMITATRFSAISAIASSPPRYSQIFDQDGISVFEEAPPEYETSQPDLLKSLPPVSRTSSVASKSAGGSDSETSTPKDGKRKPQPNTKAPESNDRTVSGNKPNPSEAQECAQQGPTIISIIPLSVDQLSP